MDEKQTTSVMAAPHFSPYGQTGSETEFLRRTKPSVAGRVLIMDDAELILMMVSLVLDTIGVEVVAATNGDEALRHFHAARAAGNPFDLIILDLVIPGGQGGEDVLRQIRLVDKKVRTVVSSGHLHHQAATQYKEFGFDASLPKPYANADVLRVAFENLPQKNT
jgi:CheY-like chemotaxis protein